MRERLSRSRPLSLLLAAAVAAASGNVTAHSLPSGDPHPDEAQHFLEERVEKDPDDFLAQNRLVQVYLRRLSEDGDYEWLRRAREAARKSLASVPPRQNASGLYLQARVEYESHHFSKARDLALELVGIEPDKSRGFALLGDALLEYGDLDEAATAYQKMGNRKAEPVEIESRLARLDLARGAHETARTRFEKAIASARSSPHASAEIIAWCLVQSGELAFDTGNWEEAEQKFQAALTARPGDVDAFIALGELRGAQEKYEEAISFYEKAIGRKPRPEFWHALGDVCAAAGKRDEAGAWYARTREAYLKNAERGNDHYFHHLARFFSDSEPNPDEALKWARRDLELRHTAAAEDTLAWALYRSGDFAQALAIAKKIVGRGVKDTKILAHAAEIFRAAEEPARGEELRAEAARVNPRFKSVSVPD